MKQVWAASPLVLVVCGHGHAQERGPRALQGIDTIPFDARLLFEERWPGQVSALLNEPYRKGERRDC